MVTETTTKFTFSMPEEDDAFKWFMKAVVKNISTYSLEQTSWDKTVIITTRTFSEVPTGYTEQILCGMENVNAK